MSVVERTMPPAEGGMKCHRCRALRLVILPLLFPIALAISGCIAVPLPPIGSQVGAHELATIKVGATTWEEARALLGEPTILDHRRFIITDVKRRDASLLVFHIGGIELGDIGHQRYRVLLAFDPQGRVKDTYFRLLIPLLDDERKEKQTPRPALSDIVATAPAPPLLRKLAETEHVETFFGALARPFGSVAFSPDGKEIAVGREAGRVLVIDVASATRRDIATTEWWTWRPCSIAFSLDGKRLAAGCRENARVWDLASGRLITTFEGHDTFLFGERAPVTALAYAPDGRAIATGGSRGDIRIWDPDSGTERLHIPSYNIQHLAFSPDGKMLANGPLIWDAKTGRAIGSLKRRGGRYASAFSPDGTRLFLNLGTHLEVWRLETDGPKPNEVATDGPGVFSLLENVFLLPDWPEEIHGSLHGPAVSLDGQMIAISGFTAPGDRQPEPILTFGDEPPRGATMLIHLPSGRMSKAFAPGSVAAAFAPDGKSLVTVGRNGVHLWAVDSWPPE